MMPLYFKPRRVVAPKDMLKGIIQSKGCSSCGR